MVLIQNLDWQFLYWIQEHLRCGFLDFLMPKITWLGNYGLIWIVCAIGLLLTKKYRKQGILLLTGLLLGVLMGNVVLKNLVARSRPCWLDPDVILLIPKPLDFSFPSGHTLSSVIAAAILTLTDHKFGLAAVPIALLIAFSRLYLFLHFPTDVLVAMLLGIGIACFVWFVGGPQFSRLMAAVHAKRASRKE